MVLCYLPRQWLWEWHWVNKVWLLIWKGERGLYRVFWKSWSFWREMPMVAHIRFTQSTPVCPELLWSWKSPLDNGFPHELFHVKSSIFWVWTKNPGSAPESLDWPGMSRIQNYANRQNDWKIRKQVSRDGQKEKLSPDPTTNNANKCAHDLFAYYSVVYKCAHDLFAYYSVVCVDIPDWPTEPDLQDIWS